MSQKDQDAIKAARDLLFTGPTVGKLVDALIAIVQAQTEKNQSQAQKPGGVEKAAQASQDDHVYQVERAVEKLSHALGTLCNELDGNIAHVAMSENQAGVTKYVASLVGVADVSSSRDLMYLLGGLEKVYGVPIQDLREEIQKKTTTSNTLFDYFADLTEKNAGKFGEEAVNSEARATVCSLIDYAREAVKDKRMEASAHGGPHLNAGRSFSQALTDLENARRHYIAGVCHRQGVYVEIDPDTPEGAAIVQKTKIQSDVKAGTPFIQDLPDILRSRMSPGDELRSERPQAKPDPDEGRTHG